MKKKNLNIVFIYLLPSLTVFLEQSPIISTTLENVTNPTLGGCSQILFFNLNNSSLTAYLTHSSRVNYY